MKEMCDSNFGPTENKKEEDGENPAIYCTVDVTFMPGILCNLTHQMGHFLNLLDSLHVSIWKRDHGKCLQQEHSHFKKRNWNVTQRTFCLLYLKQTSWIFYYQFGQLATA